MFAFGLLIAILAIGLAIFVFEVAMFLDMLKNEQIDSNTRLVWAAAMLLVHPFVAIYYYFTEYKK